jgi:hypothetical protein
MKVNRDKENNLSHDYLTTILRYDPDTGEFTYLKSRGPKAAGSRAGYLHHSGYRIIEINSKTFLEHRLAWFYCFMEWPYNNIDHIDRNTQNNRIDNLRDVNHSKNMCNRNINTNNTSGFPGVSKYNKKWKASFKNTHIGYYNSPEEAYIAYLNYRKEIEHEDTILC